MSEIPPLTNLRPERFDRPDILKRLNAASRRLAELKGVAASMPNRGILLSTLGLQEAEDSSNSLASGDQVPTMVARGHAPMRLRRDKKQEGQA